MENNENRNKIKISKIMPSNISSQAGIGFSCAGGVLVFRFRPAAGAAGMDGAGFDAAFGINGGVRG